MEKRTFYFFTAFVLLFTIGAGQYAATELQDLKEEAVNSEAQAIAEKSE